MKNQLLHTPEGVRDIYNEECEKKLELQDRLHKALKRHGYHSIQPLNFSIYLEKKLEPFHPTNYINFLTGKEIPLY